MPIVMALGAVAVLPMIQPVMEDPSALGALNSSTSFSSSMSSSNSTLLASSPTTTADVPSPTWILEDVIPESTELAFTREPIISPHSHADGEINTAESPKSKINVLSEAIILNSSAVTPPLLSMPSSSSLESVKTIKPRSVGWKDPLYDVAFIAKEGRGQSVIEYRKQVSILRQRLKRSQEIADLRGFFASPEHKSDPVHEPVVTLSTAELELLDAIYPSTSAPKITQIKPRSYDVNNPIFTFKKLNYEPTVPILPSTSNPSLSADEFALPILQTKLKNKPNASAEKRQKKLHRRRSSSDASASTVAPAVIPQPTPDQSPTQSILEEKEDVDFEFEYKLISHAVPSVTKSDQTKLEFCSSAPTSTLAKLESKQITAQNEEQQRLDSSSLMRRNMFARMPPFLRCHSNFDIFPPNRNCLSPFL